MSDTESAQRDGMTTDEAIQFAVEHLVQRMRTPILTLADRALIAQAVIALVTLQRERIEAYRQGMSQAANAHTKPLTGRTTGEPP